MNATMDWLLQDSARNKVADKKAVPLEASGPSVTPKAGTCGACTEFRASELKDHGFCKAGKTAIARARFVHVSTPCWK